MFEPNERFKYSNIGYGLLGLIIEAASGMPFGDYVRAHIVAPLGLVRTGPDWDAARAGEYSSGHTAALTPTQVRRRIAHVDTKALAAATGAYSTATELSAYFDAQRIGSGRLLSDASKRMMRRTESSVVVDHVVRHYGLGFELQQHRGVDVIGHGGGYPGHISRTWVDDAAELVVCVLTNSIDGPADMLAAGAMSLLHLALDQPQHERHAAPAVPAGRFASMWSVLDIVRLGSSVFAIPPGSPDPGAAAMRLQEDGTRLLTTLDAGFAPSGEPLVVRRGSCGAVESIVFGGITMWPIEQFSRALSSPVPTEILVRMSL